jgi:YVTN family beta-propeller protein
VANKGDRSLGLIDPLAGKQVAVIREDGVTGHEVAASPDGRLAFVPIYGDAGVGKAGSDGSLLRVMDLAKRAIVGTVDFGRGVRPHCVVVGPRNGLVYVTTELDESVTILDPKTLRIIGKVPTGKPESHMLAINADGRRGYTANVGSGTVSVLDLEARRLLGVIPVAKTIQRIALSADGRHVFTADQEKAELAVVDTASNTVTQRVSLPGIAYGTAPTPDGKWLIAALSKSGKVIVLDLGPMTVAHTFEVPRAPQEVLVQPDGAFAYISCDASSQVVMLNLKTWKIEKLINAGAGADGLAWAPGS